MYHPRNGSDSTQNMGVGVAEIKATFGMDFLWRGKLMMNTLQKTTMDHDNLGIVTAHRRRRRWTAKQKHDILAEIGQGGMSVSAVGRKYGIPVRLLFSWKRIVSEKPREGSGWQDQVLTESIEVVQLKSKMKMLEQLLKSEVAENRILEQMVESMLNSYVLSHDQCKTAS